VFESLNLTPHELSVDTLDVHADKNIFHRFDKFNLKYNPFGQSRLREVFIKQDNLIHGRFLAELTREVFVDLEASKYQHVEYRISVYGRKPVEWDMLASWVVQNRLFSSNNMWMIQVPRLYNVYKEQGIIENFAQLLDNIFAPLFEVTIDPASHPMLHLFLQQVSGFDLVDDESKPERRPVKEMPKPGDWNTKHNPAFAYYAYYVYANLYTLNRLREARGFTTFTLRPHSGEF
jgi:AMP deaminase